MQKELPHRYREDQFRRYEIYINHAVEAYPQAVKCDPILFNVSQITFVARLRDAMRSLWDNQWQTTIDKKKFREVYESLQVTERTDGTILIGTKDAVKSWMRQDRIAAVVENVNKTLLNLTNQSHQTIKDFFMYLSHNRLLIPRITFSGLTDEEVQHFQQTYDIAIDKNPDGSHTLI